jgi:hypothetical protein
MAKQKGPIKIIGTIGDLTFLKTKDGYQVREKTSLTGDRIRTDPSFARTRENIAEFGRAGKAAKLFRTAFRTAILGGADYRMMSRLISLMSTIIRTDQANPRGFRLPSAGDLSLLQDFEFNKDAQLTSSLYAPFTPTIDRVTGDIKVLVAAYIPVTMIVAPPGTTHYRLIVAGAEIDFDANFQLGAKTPSGYLPWNSTATAPLTLTASVTAASTLPLFLAFGIEFYQEVNAVKYALNNGSYNAFSIQKVDA